jgi:cell division septation protein DedD
VAPQDYKQRPPRKSTPKKKGPPPRRWRWFGAGLFVGATVTAALFLVEPDPASLVPSVSTGVGERKVAGTPRFEFYTLLPEKEIAIPEAEIAPEPPRAPSASREQGEAAPGVGAAAAEGARYLLQVGSFRSLEDADRLKARLAFMGLEPSIQTVSIDGAETWHRVRVGPFSGRSEVSEARRRLKENALDSLLLKLK